MVIIDKNGQSNFLSNTKLDILKNTNDLKPFKSIMVF